MYIRIDYYRRQNYEQFVCLFSLINFIADVIVAGQAYTMCTLFCVVVILMLFFFWDTVT